MYILQEHLLFMWVIHVLIPAETDVPILSSVDDIQTQLEDQIAKTQTMKGSPFIKPFENEIRGWEKQLVTANRIIEEWLNVQV